jgi:signal transduction histidine kinase
MKKSIFIQIIIIPILFILLISISLTYNQLSVLEEHSTDNIEFIKNNYTNEVLDIYKQKKEKLLFNNILITSIIIILFSAIAYFIFLKYYKIIKNYKEEIENKNNQLEEYKNSLKKKLENQLKEIRQKDSQIIQHYKHRTISELMGNISHQWRQPLNILSLQKDFLIAKYFENDLSKDDIEAYDNSISTLIEELSMTIDNFRNLFLKSNYREYFSIENAIYNAINMVNNNLCVSNIQIDTNITEDIEIYGYENEYTQIILNCINNAKDSLINSTNEKDNKIIEISLDIKENKAILNISDNGIGVAEEIKDNIFEPYFTTKFKSKGTGLGLYMSKIILEETLHGEIYFKPQDIGACFCIEIEITQE